jgi:hypothetical protein
LSGRGVHQPCAQQPARLPRAAAVFASFAYILPVVPQCIEDFSKLTSDPVWSDYFEAGMCTWWVRPALGHARMQCRLPLSDLQPPCACCADRRRLKVHPCGHGDGKGSHMSVFLEVEEAMWSPRAEFKITLVNQADASKSHSASKSRSGRHAVAALPLPHCKLCICPDALSVAVWKTRVRLHEDVRK